ncbi:MAG: hypothetical protein H6726_04740 [Sandaracinaceae bacterium]|nr:hypothetical protein [Sandaracinaceae bacterium]
MNQALAQNAMLSTRPARTLVTAPVVAVAALLVSCGHGGPDNRSPAGLDETLACPEGFVGWNFRTHELRTLNTQLEAEAGLLPTPLAVDISSITCGGDADSATSQAETDRIRRACAGALACDETLTCTGAVTIEYRCGDADPADETVLRSRTLSVPGSAARAISVDCSPPAADPATLPERSACVPRFCHGKSRRDADLNCVPDTTMPLVNDVSMRSGFVFQTPDSTFHDARNPYYGPLVRGENGRLPELRVGASLLSSVRIQMPDEVVPDQARVTVWMADEFKPDGRANAPDSESRWAFRCIVHSNTVTPANGTAAFERPGYTELSSRLESEMPRSCWDHADTAAVPGIHPEVEADLRRRAGLVRNGTNADLYTRNATDDPTGASVTAYRRTGTVFFVSYDVDGDLAWLREDETEENVCAPNPPAFFWDANEQAFDMFGYLDQRRLAMLNGGTRYPAIEYHRIVRVGPVEMQLGRSEMEMAQPSLGVNNLPTSSAVLPVNFKWYVTGDPEGTPHPYTFRRASSLPPLRANVYLWPVDRIPSPTGRYEGNHPSIGTIPLRGNPGAAGATISTEIDIPLRVRTLLYDPSSPLYVDPNVHGDSRAFYVTACVENTAQTFGGRYFNRSSNNLEQGEWWLVPATKPGLSGLPPSGPVFQHYGRAEGCIEAPTPVVITVDRLLRSQTPLGSSLFTGVQATSSAGDGTMSGQTDNDAETNCDVNGTGTPDPTAQNCRETASGGMAGNGELSQNYYSYDVDLTRQSASANVAIRGSVSGFMVLDPATTTTSLVSAGSSNPVTITATPPWDQIRNTLARSTMQPPGSLLRRQWTTGRYAGISGLGLAIGFKKKINIGIPGEVIFAVSAGVGLNASLAFQFAPTSNEAYPCIGGQDCVQVIGTNANDAANPPRTLSGAVTDCYARGGRLAEMREGLESQRFHDAANAAGASQQYWVGAQLAYGHPNLACLGPAYSAAHCASQMRTSFRWLSNDQEFATATGTGGATISAAHTAATSPAFGIGPSASGLLYSPSSQTMSVASADTVRPYACAYPHADSEVFLKWSLALNLSAGAGISMAFCTPTEEFGICLRGQLNFVSIALTPTLSQTNRLLFRGTTAFGLHSNLRREVPWSLTLLEGGLQIEVNVYFFSFSYPLVTFNGFRVASGFLQDPIDAPVFRSLQ